MNLQPVDLTVNPNTAEVEGEELSSAQLAFARRIELLLRTMLRLMAIEQIARKAQGKPTKSLSVLERSALSSVGRQLDEEQGAGVELVFPLAMAVTHAVEAFVSQQVAQLPNVSLLIRCFVFREGVLSEI